MLVAAAVCPCPPLLVPEVAQGAAPELDSVRAACYDAIAVLAAARPDRLAVVGPAGREGSARHPPGAGGSLRGFGVDLSVTLGSTEERAGEADTGDNMDNRGNGGHRDYRNYRDYRDYRGYAEHDRGCAGDEGGDSALPPSLTVAAWLLRRTAWRTAPVEGLEVGELLAPGHCAAAGRELAGRADRVALLVMGDGTACRTVQAPGYFDERAAAFDAAVAQALATADTAALLALQTAPAAELKAAGRSGWQVLAGAAQGTALSGQLLYDDAPYGVGYLVAAWS